MVLPLLRVLGILTVEPGRLGLWVAAVGGIAALLAVYLMLSPPDPPVDAFGATATDPSAELTVKWGAVAGLLAALGILAGGLITNAPARPARAKVRARRAKPRPARATRPARRATSAAPSPEPAPKPAPAPAAAAIPLARIDLDGLMELGLSRTQAKRVLRYRDELGLVASVADLEVVPGIPKATRADLRAKLTD